VRRDQRGRSGPIRPPTLRDADGVRASGIDHAVQDDDTDGGFGVLTGQLAGMETVAEDALVSRHRSFGLGPLAIVGFPLPAQVALVGNAPDMPVTRSRPPSSSTQCGFSPVHAELTGGTA
jgi:hypothetical protein